VATAWVADLEEDLADRLMAAFKVDWKLDNVQTSIGIRDAKEDSPWLGSREFWVKEVIPNGYEQLGARERALPHRDVVSDESRNEESDKRECKFEAHECSE
jgi:hypothetical protein